MTRLVILDVELDGKNHVIWKYKIQNILMGKELLKLVEKNEKPSTNKLELKIYEARNKDSM